MDNVQAGWRRYLNVSVGVFMILCGGMGSAGSSAAASVSAAPRPIYNLQDLVDRAALSRFVYLVCAGGYRDMSLVRLLAPPHALVSDDAYRCSRPLPDFDSERQRLVIPVGLLSTEHEHWLRKAYQLMQEGKFTYMSEWQRLQDPRDISFLQRGFATHPYLSARMMASSPAPMLGESWRLLATHMDRILLASTDGEDRRLLAFAMARDGREQEALTVIEEQLKNGDALALHDLPYVSLDMPAAVDDAVTDSSEPTLGYRVVPMLENYLIEQQYPQSFCDWATTLASGPLKFYVNMVLVNAREMLACPHVNDEAS